jgi:hypothetical protein
MRLTIQLITFWTFIFFAYGQLNAQGQLKHVDSTKTEYFVRDSSRFDKIDSGTENIIKQLSALQEKVTLINKTVETIDDNTDDSILAEGAKNFLFTFIYELLGYKSGSSTGWVSKIVSGISFLFLLFRIYFFVSKKDKEHPKFTKAVNFYLVCLSIFALSLPWTASLFPNKEMDKEQIIRVTENAKKLNREVEKIQSADFTKLVNDIQELQKLRVDTIQLAKESSIKAFDAKFNLLQNQLLQANKKLDSIGSRIINDNNYKNKNIARRGPQVFQTWLIVLTFIMVFIFFIIIKPWNE